MILYKYIGFDADRKIIENLSMGFSQPQHFNDPFDLPSYPAEKSDDPVENLFVGIRTWAKTDVWTRNTGILAPHEDTDESTHVGTLRRSAPRHSYRY